MVGRSKLLLWIAKLVMRASRLLQCIGKLVMG